jgi:hypothetical protein
MCLILRLNASRSNQPMETDLDVDWPATPTPSRTKRSYVFVFIVFFNGVHCCISGRESMSPVSGIQCVVVVVVFHSLTNLKATRCRSWPSAAQNVSLSHSGKRFYSLLFRALPTGVPKTVDDYVSSFRYIVLLP